MFRQLVIVGLIAYCSAVPVITKGYGGYGGGLVAVGGYGGGYGGGAHVNAAIQSTRHVSVVPVHSNQGISAPTVVDIDSGEQPVVLNFNSRSSTLQASQGHIGQAGTIQSTASVDEPHRLVHEVTRPVIQEVREVITPFRDVVQEVRPVQENVRTVVAQGQGNVNGGQLIATGAGIGGGVINGGGAIVGGVIGNGVIGSGLGGGVVLNGAGIGINGGLGGIGCNGGLGGLGGPGCGGLVGVGGYGGIIGGGYGGGYGGGKVIRVAHGSGGYAKKW